MNFSASGQALKSTEVIQLGVPFFGHLEWRCNPFKNNGTSVDGAMSFGCTAMSFVNKSPVPLTIYNYGLGLKGSAGGGGTRMRFRIRMMLAKGIGGAPMARYTADGGTTWQFITMNYDRDTGYLWYYGDTPIVSYPSVPTTMKIRFGVMNSYIPAPTDPSLEFDREFVEFNIAYTQTVPTL